MVHGKLRVNDICLPVNVFVDWFSPEVVALVDTRLRFRSYGWHSVDQCRPHNSS